MRLRRLRTVATAILYLLMLAAVLVMWSNDAPRFIYVAF